MNESIRDINYPELLIAFYYRIIYMHIKKVYNNQFEGRKKDHLPERGTELTTLQIS